MHPGMGGESGQVIVWGWSYFPARAVSGVMAVGDGDGGNLWLIEMHNAKCSALLLARSDNIRFLFVRFAKLKHKVFYVGVSRLSWGQYEHHIWNIIKSNGYKTSTLKVLVSCSDIVYTLKHNPNWF